MRVGWARPGCLPDLELGSDDQAFVFDGFKVSGFLFANAGHTSKGINLRTFSVCAQKPDGPSFHLTFRNVLMLSKSVNGDLCCVFHLF